MPPNPAAPAEPHGELVAALEAMRRALGPLPQPLPAAQLQALAGSFAAVAGAYLRLVVASGRTSMRAEAAARALDLTTPKSALLRFLGRDGP